MQHRIVSRDEWLETRTALLAKEKELTRLRDRLSAERRELPWVQVEKPYVFDAPEGKATLADLFDGRSQLIVKHFMLAPGQKDGCVGCSFEVDHVEGALVHLEHHDVSYVAVARAPLAEIEAFKKRMGWHFRWVSSFGSDFNYDFCATLDKARPQLEYNYRSQPDLLDGETSAEVSGLSCFLRDGGEVFHTYSTWARGSDTLGSTYSLLDLTALGRQEDWEEPKGRAPRVHGADPTFRD
jgi:predicted dithiol-disulfide oxidoreductase (DUF899 family)